MEVRAPDSHLSNLASLPLPNPFKAIKSRSADHLPLSERTGEPGRVSLEEETDLGELLGRGPLLGFRSRRINGAMFGIAWSSEELTVRVEAEGFTNNTHSLLALPVSRHIFSSSLRRSNQQHRQFSLDRRYVIHHFVPSKFTFTPLQ